MSDDDVQPVTRSFSTHIDASAAVVYSLVSDITRTGEWSVGCRAAEWVEPARTGVGAQFIGHNESPVRQWDTTCTVVAADPEREFAWEVGDGWSRWSYWLAPTEGGTELTHSWTYLPAGLKFWGAKHGDRAQEQLDIRIAAAEVGMPRTLAAIKEIAEADS